jgi:hypothetical protein
LERQNRPARKKRTNLMRKIKKARWKSLGKGLERKRMARV